jgi:predicted P-loop ATPase
MPDDVDLGRIEDPFERIAKTREEALATIKWRDKFRLGAKGKPLRDLDNLLILLSEDPFLSHCFGYNEMERAPTLMHALPTMPELEGYDRLTDNDYLHVQRYVQHFEFPGIGLEIIRNAVDYQCRENPFNPVMDYLDGLVWDGKQRFDRLFPKYFGATASNVEYLQEISRCFLLAMVARIYDPGCKADYMVVLEGAQGIGKSQACRILGGDYFGDNLPPLDGHNEKEVSAFLAGKWLVEDSELASHNRGEINRLKSFLSRQEEDFRRPYARLPVFERRTCILIGTTNEETYLRDTTGGRRFWPVKCGPTIDLEGLKRDRDQLFAEAVYWRKELKVLTWWPQPQFDAILATEQEDRYEVDPWESIIADNSTGLVSVGRSQFCDWFGFNNKELSGVIYKRLGTIMKRLGWVRKHTKHGNYWTRNGQSQRELDDSEGL